MADFHRVVSEWFNNTLGSPTPAQVRGWEHIRSGRHTRDGSCRRRATTLSSVALLRSVRQGDLDRIVSQDAPLDVLAQQVTAELACCDYTEDDLSP